MVAIVVGSNSQRLGEHFCQSWEECHEWIDSFISWHGLSRKQGYSCARGEMRVWVKETAI
jgi:hypothetical protein